MEKKYRIRSLISDWVDDEVYKERVNATNTLTVLTSKPFVSFLEKFKQAFVRKNTFAAIDRSIKVLENENLKQPLYFMERERKFLQEVTRPTLELRRSLAIWIWSWPSWPTGRAKVDGNLQEKQGAKSGVHLQTHDLVPQELQDSGDHGKTSWPRIRIQVIWPLRYFNHRKRSISRNIRITRATPNTRFGDGETSSCGRGSTSWTPCSYLRFVDSTRVQISQSLEERSSVAF